MSTERLQLLAALNAVGALNPEESEELQRALASGDAVVKTDVARFQDLAALIATSTVTPRSPSPAVKARLFERLERRLGDTPPGTAAPGQSQVKWADDESAWTKLPIPGAWVKLLSIDHVRGYAVVLGKLDAGARYPAHRHYGAEDVYLLTGDLHLGDVTLHAGDFHHADPGTTHGVNYSEQGCTLLAVVSTQDLQGQTDLNSDKWIKS